MVQEVHGDVAFLDVGVAKTPESVTRLPHLHEVIRARLSSQFAEVRAELFQSEELRPQLVNLLSTPLSMALWVPATLAGSTRDQRSFDPASYEIIRELFTVPRNAELYFVTGRDNAWCTFENYTASLLASFRLHQRRFSVEALQDLVVVTKEVAPVFERREAFIAELVAIAEVEDTDRASSRDRVNALIRQAYPDAAKFEAAVHADADQLEKFLSSCGLHCSEPQYQDVQLTIAVEVAMRQAELSMARLAVPFQTAKIYGQRSRG